ncbi:HlyD family type I secretion periplasmic adaptor subunit [Paremcibacter congregatus]|uniref:Membrane fusion protein (MFP) family protein n=1 Tax=Paremcibacter congregatus TaxID=2043170 RepID=A0A2G4YRE3_9PROT|nr:HlyD family type I secretion periplasmic adaptor subunit [Paremcibacter congregatus]PHZ84026.1 secretion protein HylD [Paremcibacter congregatus]QDE26295.1 HlyD family type I secretion periplasmic adaptor subunit [Paremcibacter congregatus]
MFDGLMHHLDVWKAAYRTQKMQEKKAFQVEEADFLPAALEILEKPASPIGRGMMFMVILFFTLALIWSIFGRVDVVATGQGKITPLGDIKVIQPAELGVVRRILVGNGQAVMAGDSLLELDTTMSLADSDRARRELQVAQLSKVRFEAILSALETGESVFDTPPGVTPKVARMQKLLVTSELDEYDASLETYRQQKVERQAEAKVVAQEIGKLTETLPLLREQVEARAELLAKGLTPRFQYLEYQERLVGQTRDLQIQKDQLLKVEAAIIGADRQIRQRQQEFLKNTYGGLAEAEDQIVALTAELTKTTKRQELQVLRAPVDGIVQQLGVHTIGGVVQAGDALMVLVPNDRTLMVEANILNKDIGFVTAGQQVEVKLEAFPFTKYGVIHGEVIHLAQNAVADENLGLIYPARISLKTSTIRVRGKDINLSPGMSVTAEVKTGKRRLIEFLLSPLLRYKDESLRER